jgi:predicted NAD-dependent protein-ADP-ribosyltransferase YbiA (DUF1768 family)
MSLFISNSLSLLLTMNNPNLIMSSDHMDRSLEIYRFKSTVNNSHSFMSNFYPDVKNFSSESPQPSVDRYLCESYDGKVFHSVEQYYQYQKFLYIDEEYAYQMILPSGSASNVKRISGKGYYVDYKYKNNNPLKMTKTALKHKFDVGKSEFFQHQALSAMRSGLYMKFTQNPELKQALIDTYPHPLSEIGRMKRDYWAHTGQDMLGKLLMEIRLSLVNKINT